MLIIRLIENIIGACFWILIAFGIFGAVTWLMEATLNRRDVEKKTGGDPNDTDKSSSYNWGRHSNWTDRM